MAARVEFAPLFKYPREREVVMAEARSVAPAVASNGTDVRCHSGEEMAGHECIKCLMLEGDETMFHTQF